MNSCIEYVFLTFDNDNENSEVSTLSFEYIFYRLVFEVDRLFEQSHSCICLHGPLSKTTSTFLASFFFLGFNHYRLLIRYHIMQAFTLE